MKTIYKINYDGMFSNIEQVQAINDFTGELINIDNDEYFYTISAAKKQLVKELTNKMNNLKCTIKRIKELY